MASRTTRYFSLGINDFNLVFGFTLKEARTHLRNHAYLLTGWKDYTWCIGLNYELRLCLWIGDRSAWTVVESLPISEPLRTATSYQVRMTRKSDEITFYLGEQSIFSMALPENFFFSGSHLGFGAFEYNPTPWDLDISLLESTLAPLALSNRSEFRKKIELFSMFYGDLYSRTLSETMFPSLRLSGNLPQLQGREIVHRIYCTEAERPLLTAHIKELDALGIGHVINTEYLSDCEDSPRKLLHLPLEDAILRSYKEHWIVVMAQPDHVFGHGLARIIDAMQPFEYVVCGHPRICQETALPRLPSLIRVQADNPKADNSYWVSHAMGELAHPMVKHGLRHREPYWHALTTDNHFAAYFKEPPPLCFHGSPDMIGIMHGITRYSPFEAIDHELVDYMHQEGRLRVVDDSRFFFWAELTSQDKYNPTIRNDYMSPAASMLSQRPLIWRRNSNRSAEPASL